MRRTATFISSILILLIFTCPISAKLGIFVDTGRNMVHNEFAINELDYALYAANGREWFVNNVLFNEYGSVHIFFAPGDFIAMTFAYSRYSSKHEITKDYIMGIKKAIDYMAEHDRILYIKDLTPVADAYGEDMKSLLEGLHIQNHWLLFIYPEWRAEARFGNLNEENSREIVSMFYNNRSTINAFGMAYQKGNLVREYEDSCRKKGVRPVLLSSPTFQSKPEDYSDADIDFFLECRFGNLDFNKTQYYKELYPTQEFVHVMDYAASRSNEKTFQFFKTVAPHPVENNIKEILKDRTLTVAVYPSDLGPGGRIRSISRIIRAMYEANGHEWFVKNVLFSQRLKSDLYFPTDGLFCFRTEYTPDEEFAAGLARAIDLLSARNDTLCAPVSGWKAPYAINDNAVDDWIEKNRRHYVLDDTWTAEIKVFGLGFRFRDPERPMFEPFALDDINIWPHFDNGTEESLAFRLRYEEECRNRNLRIIHDRDPGQLSDYCDDDINLFVEWIMRANDYYISLPLPSEMRTIDVRYCVEQVEDQAITTREIYRL